MVLTAETYNPVFWGVAFCFLVLISILSLVMVDVIRSATVGILSLWAILVAVTGLFIWSFSGGGMVVDKPNFIPKEPKAAVTEVIQSSNARIDFDSLTVTGYSVGSTVSCNYSSSGSAESASPIQSGSVARDGGTNLSWYAYPMTVPMDSTKAGSILSCSFLFDNLSANCSVNLSSPATNGGNKYVLNAMASFNNGVSESLGIAGGTVRFSGLEYGKSYAFGDTSLEVAEDGTAVGEFTVPDYGYVDKEFPDLYSVRLVRAEGNSLETELILYVKRPIKSVVDARAGK